MEIVVFYFTGTGNTLWAVQRFAESLSRRGANALLIPIGQAPVDDGELAELVRTADELCFAYPIYGANMPPAMRAFLGRLAEHSAAWAPSKPACCITTFGYINGYGPIEARKLLAAAGFRMRSHVNVSLCNNASTPKTKSEPIPVEKLARRKVAAISALDRAVAALLAGKRFVRGIGPWLPAGHIIRRFFGPMIEQNYKSMGVELSLCKQCMLCVAQCPTGSIVYRESEGFEFLQSCSACFRCYNNCPSCAVTVGGMIADPEVYQRYRGMED